MKFQLSKKTLKKIDTTQLSWNPIHPKRDWTRLLGGFFVGLILVIGWSIYLFYTSKHASEVEPVTEVQAETISDRIEKIETFFDARKVPTGLEQ